MVKTSKYSTSKRQAGIKHVIDMQGIQQDKEACIQHEDKWMFSMRSNKQVLKMVTNMQAGIQHSNKH